MSEEDRIDEIIRNAASDYNRPPATPRDDMWAKIQAAQSAPGPKLHVAGGARASQFGGYRDKHRFATRYAWIGMAAAAVLLIATGVGIGRWSREPSVAGTVRAPGAKVIADNPADVPSFHNDEIPSGSEPALPAPSSETPAPAPQPSKGRTHDEIVKDPRIVGQKTLRPLPGTTQVAQNTSEVYSLATAQHLASAEALLTSFTLGGSRDKQMDAQFSQWAKGLLSNTRLLLDSPAGDDPRRAKLLQDLELVLAQIVQLSPNAAATDRELVQGSIQQGQVITRLRTAIPAGQPSLER
jgi:hypothetical protein